MKNMTMLNLFIVCFLSFNLGCGPAAERNETSINDNSKSADMTAATQEPNQMTIDGANGVSTKETTAIGDDLQTSTTLKENPSVMSLADHAAFNTMLQKFVSNTGAVNYAGWKKSESTLDAYLVSLAAAIPTSATAKNEALAYWINAYNAYTIKLILKNYPVVKITDLNAGKPWDVQWITLAGKKYSLNDIENKVIRPTFKEPRIHFAVNCAAKSCPPLANKAFTAANLNSMLEERTKTFINSNLNSITKEKITVSKIFDWYKEDFGNVVAYINKYATTKANANAAISYNEYNWALNK